MRIISRKDLEKIDFDDFEVQLDRFSKTIFFYLNGAYYLVDGNWTEFGKG